MSYKTIMIPIDGSPFSEQALPVALSLARAAGAALRLVGVHDFNPAVYACAESTVVFDVDESVLDAEQQHLKALAATWASRSNLPCTATVVTHAAAAEGLLQEARALRPDLLVVATHGRGPLSRAWLGSVAQELITQASSPVLVVRPRGGEVDLKAEPAFRHVLVPLDGSPQSELVVESALALGAPFQAEYHLVRVLGSSAELDNAKRYLDALAAKVAVITPRVFTHVGVAPHVATDILRAAEALHVDVIAMETHGRRGFQRWRLGSVADKVIRGASVPVLTHRTPRQDAPAAAAAPFNASP